MILSEKEQIRIRLALADDHAGEKQRLRQHVEHCRGLLDTVLSCITSDLPCTANAQAALEAASNVLVAAARVDLMLRTKGKLDGR